MTPVATSAATLADRYADAYGAEGAYQAFVRRFHKRQCVVSLLAIAHLRWRFGEGVGR